MGLIIDFSNKICLSSGKTKNFTNYLSGKDEYVKSITHILSKIVPEISEKSFNELKNNKRYHTHMLDNVKVNNGISILKELVKNCYGYANNEIEMWLENQGLRNKKLCQVACPDSRGIRLIGFLNDNATIFHVLFIDYYHQLFPSEKHNQDNIEKNNFSILEYIKEIG